MSPGASPATARARFLGASVELSCRSEDLIWLAEFLHPHLQRTTTLGSGPWRVQVTEGIPGETCCSAPPEEVDTFTLDGSFRRLPAWPTSHGARVLRDDELGVFYSMRGRRITVGGARRPWHNRLALLRVVREIGTARALADGAAPVHAAALDIGGRGVLLVGAKGSGKTSLLLHLLRAGRASLISNDRALVERDGDSWRVGGIPTVIALRRGTLRLLPELERRFRHAPVRYKWTLDECRNLPVAEVLGISRRPELSGPQLAALAGVELIQGSPLGAVVFPRLEPSLETWKLERLTAESFADRLCRGLLRPGSRVAIATAFRQRGDPSSPELETHLRGLCTRVAATVPGFVCHLGPRAYAEPTAAAELAAEVTGP